MKTIHRKITRFTSSIVLKKNLLVALVITALFMLGAGAPSATGGI